MYAWVVLSGTRQFGYGGSLSHVRMGSTLKIRLRTTIALGF